MTAIADFARQFTGVPYAWPAPDGDNSDCADFANAVYAHLGQDHGGSSEDSRT